MKANDRRGFTLVVVCLCVVSLLGMLGLSLDLGRVYVAKNEVQSFTDSAALATSLELNGESLTAAQDAVKSDTANRWNMGATTLTDPNGSAVVTTEFAKALATNALRPDPSTWSSAPISAAGYTFVRVTATATLPLYILPVVGANKAQLVAASSVAGQVPLTTFEGGLLPFSPIAHTGGLVVGNWYTLRYPGAKGEACSGDKGDAAVVGLANRQPAEERGFYQDPQESLVRDEVVDGVMPLPLAFPGTITVSGGTVNMAQRALNERIDFDTDHTSTTYAQYQANVVNGKRIGNGFRLAGAPLNAGTGANGKRIVTGFGGFFLSASPTSVYYPPGGESAWCAEYYGVWNRGGHGSGAGVPGVAYTSVLVQ